MNNARLDCFNDIESVLGPLELEEPMLTAWRYHGNQRQRSQAFIWLARAALSRRFSFRSVALPSTSSFLLAAINDTPTTWGLMEPVARELVRRGHAVFGLVGPQAVAVRRSNLFSGFIDLRQLLSTASFRRRVQNFLRARRLTRRVFALLPGKSIGEAENWLEFGFTLRDVFARWAKGAGGLLLDSTLGSGRTALALGARECGVPSYVLQHGLFGPHQFPMLADQLLTWGKLFSTQAVTYGTPASQISTTGCPRWDHLVQLRKQEPDSAVRQALGGKDGVPLVMLISNAHGAGRYPRHYAAYFKAVEKLVACRALDVIVKLHPMEKDLSHYMNHLPSYVVEQLSVVPQSIGLYEALRHVDCVYHLFSAAALEAMLLGVPVLFERAGDSDKLCDFPDHGGGGWTSPDLVVEECRGIGTQGPYRAQFLARQEEFLDLAFSNLGSATTTVVDRILRNLESHSVSSGPVAPR